MIMRVLFIPDVGENYGAAKSFQEMVYMLAEVYGVEPVLLLSKDEQLAEFARKNGYEYHISGHKAFYISSGSTKLRKIIKTFLRPLYALQYKYANKKALGIVAEEVNMDKIHLIHTNVNRNDIGALIAQKYKKKHVWHLREFGEDDYECISLRKNYICFMNQNTTRFIAISKAVESCWINKGIRKNKINCIYNGVDVKKFKRDPSLVQEEKLRICMTGSISPGKGHMQLFEAVNLLPNDVKDRIEVDVFGTGVKEYEYKLKKFIKSKRLENIIRFLGYEKNISEKLNSYHIGVVCSRAEGFGRVTVEYMLSGLCVIASNTGANTEIINNGIDGYTYEYGNPDSLKNIICDLFYNMGKIAIVRSVAVSKASSLFTSEVNAKKIYELYVELCKD